MKKILALILCAAALSGCKQENNFTLQGELTGLISDTIWVVYDDPVSKTDTIYAENGKFTYVLAPDTLQLFRLVSPRGESLPVFAGKTGRASVKGTFTQPAIEGDGANGEYGQFLKGIEGISSDADLKLKAEEFVKAHPQSFASAYLIDRYFIQPPEPDLKKIEELIRPLGGNIKDSRILSIAMQALPAKPKTAGSSDYINYFSCKDRNGKYISWTGTKENYTLLNFWASWDEASLNLRDSLSNLAKKFPEDRFKVLNISLDYEKEKWAEKCKKDSKQWIESCDFKGWGTQLVKQNNISHLPMNILIDRNRKVIATNIYGQELYDKVSALVKEAEK